MKKKKTSAVSKTRLKVGDEVVVIAGKFKKSTGKILAKSLEKGQVWVQGVNLRKKFMRPSQENPKGGAIETEGPVHISNVMFYDGKLKKGSRLSAGKNKAGKKVRIAKRSNKEID